MSGRWWHTAFSTVITYTLVGFSGFVVGLLLLVTFTSLPFWALSVVVTLVGALVMPLGGIAVTLLYGDALAEHDGSQSDQPAAEASSVI